MPVPLLDLTLQYASIKADVDHALADVVQLNVRAGHRFRWVRLPAAA